MYGIVLAAIRHWLPHFAGTVGQQALELRTVLSQRRLGPVQCFYKSRGRVVPSDLALSVVEDQSALGTFDAHDGRSVDDTFLDLFDDLGDGPFLIRWIALGDFDKSPHHPGRELDGVILTPGVLQCPSTPGG